MSIGSKTVQGWTFLYDKDTAEITPSTDGTHITLDVTYTDATYLTDSFSHIYVMEPFQDADSFGLRQTVEIRLHNETTGNFKNFSVMTSDLDNVYASDPAFHPSYAHWHNVTTDNFPGQQLTATSNAWSSLPTAPGSQTTGPSAANFWTDGVVPAHSTAVWGTAGASDLVLHQIEHAANNDSFVISYWAIKDGPSTHGTATTADFTLSATPDAIGPLVAGTGLPPLELLIA